MGGKLSFPGGAYYHATKHALEAYSDILRFEVKPFGVDVAVVEPGLIKTNFGDNATATVDPESDDVYSSYNEALSKTISGAYEGRWASFALGPEEVAKTIQSVVETSRPKTRYMVPGNIRALLALRRLLPDRAFDALLRRTHPVPKP